MTNTSIRGLQIRDAFFGDGLKRNGVDANIAEVDFKANDGLEIDTNQLTINYDDTSIGIIANALAIKASGVTTAKIADDNVTEAKLDIAEHAGTAEDGYVLYWDNASGKLAYKDVDTDFISDADLVKEDLAYDDFGLSNTPVANSLHLYLNGLLQEEGSGKDFTIDTATITWATVPEATDIVIAYYVKA